MIATQVYDLSVDRSGKVETIAVPRGTKAVAVLRCDVPATLFLGGANADPIGAIPGVVISDPPGNIYLQNWANHYDGLATIDQGGGGKLTLGFYDCPVSGAAQGGYPFALPLGDQEATAADARLEILPPGADWSVYITGLAYGYTGGAPAGPANNATFTFAEYPRSGTLVSIGILRERDITTQGLKFVHFSKPLISPPGYMFTASVLNGGAGVDANVYAWGAIIR